MDDVALRFFGAVESKSMAAAGALQGMLAIRILHILNGSYTISFSPQLTNPYYGTYEILIKFPY